MDVFNKRFAYSNTFITFLSSADIDTCRGTSLDIDGKETKSNNASSEVSETVGSPLRQAAAMATNLTATSNVEQTATRLENDAAIKFNIPEPIRGDASREGDVAGGPNHLRRDHRRSEFHPKPKSASEGCDRSFTSSMPQDDVEKGGRGSKWNLAGLRKRLAWMGFNVPALWEEINELVIKTLIAIEGQVCD